MHRPAERPPQRLPPPERPATPTPQSLSRLDGPVHRYLHHALGDHAPAHAGMRIAMRGHIRFGLWLPFRAEWVGDGRRFTWSASVGPGHLDLVRVVDRFADGHGSTSMMVTGCLPLLNSDGDDVSRSGAGRAAAEAIWAPAALLPQAGTRWRAEADDLIVATLDIPPEQPELTLCIDAEGRVTAATVMRWDARSSAGGYVACGAEVLAEETFGPLTIPSHVRVGWGFGTPAYEPFFEAHVISAEPIAGDGDIG